MSLNARFSVKSLVTLFMKPEALTGVLQQCLAESLQHPVRLKGFYDKIGGT
jgi:hypothetical protein